MVARPATGNTHQSRGGEEPRRSGVFVALGSNLGDRAATLRSALRALDHLSATRVVRCSSFHETEPQGGPPGQGRYLNAVAELSTALPPRALLDRLLEIERQHGRTRAEPGAARTLDLDLLLYGDERFEEPGLHVPHPRMWSRSFVLEPLAELCGPDRLAKLRGRCAGPATD